jgi:hypothetical protein
MEKDMYQCAWRGRENVSERLAGLRGKYAAEILTSEAISLQRSNAQEVQIPQDRLF